MCVAISWELYFRRYQDIKEFLVELQSTDYSQNSQGLRNFVVVIA